MGISQGIDDDPEEKARIAALEGYAILDTDFESDFDDIVNLASAICAAPISLVSLVDTQRQWFKAKVGLEARQTPRSVAFCAHAILDRQTLVVEDALLDARFADNPLVTADPGIRFYAGAPLLTADGHALGTLCVMDRVPRQLDQAQLTALQRLSRQVIALLELRLSLKRQRELSAQLRLANKAKDKFIELISHDMRTPFTGILGYSEILADSIHSLPMERSQAMAKSIHQSAQSALRLLQNMLHWAMYDSGRIEIHPIECRLLEVCQQACSLASGAASGKSLRLTLDCAEDALASADPNMLLSVLQNLLGNAIKFTPAGGRITCSVSTIGAELEIGVSDSGVGMTPGKLRQIQRLESASSMPGTAGEAGTGLGLMLCKRFVELHGSRLKIESEHGVGSTFSFRLPQLTPATSRASEQPQNSESA